MLACTGTWGALLPTSLSTGIISALAWVTSMATAESMSECVPLAHSPPAHSLALSFIFLKFFWAGVIMSYSCEVGTSQVEPLGFCPLPISTYAEVVQVSTQALLIWCRTVSMLSRSFKTIRFFQACSGVWAQRIDSIAMMQNLSSCFYFFFPLAYYEKL